MRLFRRLHDRVAPPGLEWRLLRAMPYAAIAAVLVPASIAFGGRVYAGAAAVPNPAKTITTIDIFAWSLLATLLTAVLTVAIGCVVVWIMKGPAYVADAYPVAHASRPGDGQASD
ncbi:MAG: hypothetical protein AAFX56_15270 [Pseudomonadota bacterium]